MGTLIHKNLDYSQCAETEFMVKFKNLCTQSNGDLSAVTKAIDLDHLAINSNMKAALEKSIRAHFLYTAKANLH